MDTGWDDLLKMTGDRVEGRGAAESARAGSQCCQTREACEPHG
jgi:hypothetical protein